MDMEKLRKQIRESFFNPVLQFLPLLIFLVVDDFLGINLAWKISFPIALIVLTYIYFLYDSVFTWYLISALVFMAIAIISSALRLYFLSDNAQLLLPEIVTEVFLLAYLLFRKRIQLFILRLMPSLVPMTNNFNELYRVILSLFIVLLTYVSIELAFSSIGLDNPVVQNQIHYVVICIIVFLIAYEVLRVQIVRAKLLREEWWPIVNEQGRIVGNIEHMTSLNDEKKYRHPFVRVLIIDKGMVYMQKRSSDSQLYPGLWDTAISNHVIMGETIECCVERTAMERYLIDCFKYMHLANYQLEVEKELHYAFLFVSCQQADFKLNPDFAEQLKWWTQQQIEDNLNTGIFTENFKIEYDLLKRSGLLETGKCECSCRLKEVIYQQPSCNKKE